MNYDTYEEYYRQSRGYTWHDMAQLRSIPRQPVTQVPAVFQDEFATPQEYEAWLERKRNLYFYGHE